MALIFWSDAAELFLLSAAPSEAERILTAVEVMATEHRGFVRRMLDGAGTFGLYLPGYVVLFRIDAQGTIRIDEIRVRPEQ